MRKDKKAKKMKDCSAKSNCCPKSTKTKDCN